MKIGEKIRKLRTERRLTMEQVAQELGVTFQAVGKWELNTVSPTIEHIPAIARFFNVTTDYLLIDGDEHDDSDKKEITGKEEYLSSARIHRNAKNYKKALDDLAKSLEIDEKFEIAYYDRGFIYLYRTADYDKAIEDFTKAIEFSTPNWYYHKWAYYQRASSHRKVKKYKQAIEDFTKALELDEKFGWVYYHRGFTYLYNIFDYDKAIADFTKAIKVSTPDVDYHPWVYYERAISYRKIKNHEQQSIEDFTKAIEIDENYKMAYYQRGFTYLYRTSDYDKAIEDFTKAIEVSTPDWEYHKWSYLQIGMGYKKLYNYKEAITAFEQAIKIDENFAEAFSRCAICYEALGEHDKAKEYHRIAESLIDILGK